MFRDRYGEGEIQQSHILFIFDDNIKSESPPKPTQNDDEVRRGFRASVLAMELPVSIGKLLDHHDRAVEVLRAEGRHVPNLLSDELVRTIFQASLEKIHANDRREIYKQPGQVWKPAAIEDVLKDHDEAVALLHEKGRRIDNLLSLEYLAKHALINDDFASAMDLVFERIDSAAQNLQGNIKDMYRALKAIAAWHTYGDAHTAPVARQAVSRIGSVAEKLAPTDPEREIHPQFIKDVGQRLLASVGLGRQINVVAPSPNAHCPNPHRTFFDGQPPRTPGGSIHGRPSDVFHERLRTSLEFI